MTGIEPLAAITSSALQLAGPMSSSTPVAGASGFGDLLVRGLQNVDAKIGKADALMQSFAKGEPIPLHQVTLALEQARMSVDLAMEVRARLVEAHRDFMSMQV
ncbi:flagellar hook-basal body complex protein FliE [Sphingomonas colocasiae]|uniref:Flagellar hook-basal body complex protein FliE n=1 Tax=Sphingomonas colocasiae TaxID=1848973 RepID=A0ABS7PY22_9SPHN|nr:flagellar hook-basal body complex protein FliE [Sphingomonas colocasiae]MBY8825555.1 flagellar hook-basal body complex protein FliE [Sphingomonas colocasiae]